MKHLLYTLLMTSFFCTQLFGGTLEGTIVDEKNVAVEFVNVILHKTEDPSFIDGAMTDSLGKFRIDGVQDGQYFLEIVFLGYQSDTIEHIVMSNNEKKNLGTVALVAESNMLDGVEIVAARPVIERKADRIVYNVENSTKANGENVMDLLRSVPGVTVSGDDQIRVNGKTEVQVMINGKIEQMSADQLANLLKSLQSSNVKKIEVISNPSAKYDANAKGGILDIQLKSNLNTGMNGTVYANYRQNKYASSDMGFNLNVNYKKLTLGTNYNYGYNRNYNTITYLRNFKQTNATQQFDEVSNNENKFLSHYANLNLRYAINDNNAISIGSEFFNFKNPGEANSNLNILNDNTTDVVNLIQKTKTVNDGKSINPSASFNYKSTLDTTGSTLQLTYDYTYFKLDAESHLNSLFFDSLGVANGDFIDFKQDNPFIVNLHTSKLDYYKPLKNKHTLELGAKFTWTKTYNNIKFTNLVGDVYVIDNAKSNEFRYIENINALYAIWSKEWKKGWSTNMGLRAEQTNTDQYSITLDSITKKHYIDLFPSVFVQKNLKDKHNFNLNYSRKIHRPDFQDLNPFQYYNSPYSIWTGNSNLKPEYINVTEFTYTFDNSYSFFVGHENIHDSYTHLVFQDDSTKISTYRASNFKVRNNLNVGVNINKELFKWWSISYSAQYTFFKYDAIVNDEPFNLTSNQLNLTFDNTFSLPKDFRINLFAFYISPFLDATDIMKSDGMVNLSISKAFLEKKLRVRLGVNDLFATKNFSYDTDYANVDSETRNTWGSRFVSLSVSYNFQKGKQFQNSRIEKSNEEEQNRIN
ncbi:MAG: TonB-dependent receptor [Chitinophagales bacterium]|nr:TonB-dependent receptor [Chitinophagales bacterium]